MTSSRPGLAALAAAAAAAVCAPAAGAEAVVDVRYPTGAARFGGSPGAALSVVVQPRAGGDGQHGLVVEPIERNGLQSLRVRQMGLGDPAITHTPNVECGRNFLLNEVACLGAAVSIAVTGGDERDRVRLGRLQPASVGTFTCVAGTLPRLVPVTVRLGAGSDELGVGSDDHCPVGSRGGVVNGRGLEIDFAVVLTARGGSGADTLRGGPGNDELRGESGNDLLLGDAGADQLFGGAGDDELLGQTGNDRLSGGGGDDRLAGGSGDDIFLVEDAGGTDGRDRYVGGSGFDTLSYASRTVPLEITLASGSAFDGAAGEGDTVVEIEAVTGGSARDRIVGTAAEETLSGRGGDDVIDGGGGIDRLFGGDGNDHLTGGPGIDDISGGAGSDFFSLRDGEVDVVDCGPGVDTVQADLRDSLTGCELVDRTAIDDVLPGRPTLRRLSLAGRGTMVGFSCPRTAKPRCHGILRVRDPRSKVVLGSARYAFALGRRGSVRVALSAREQRLLRSRRRALVETTEESPSQIGPRGVSYLLPVVGP
jgi:hypothetical protein